MLQNLHCHRIATSHAPKMGTSKHILAYCRKMRKKIDYANDVREQRFKVAQNGF